MRFPDGSYIEQGSLYDAAGAVVTTTYDPANAGTYRNSNGVLMAPGSQSDGGGLVVVQAAASTYRENGFLKDRDTGAVVQS